MPDEITQEPATHLVQKGVEVDTRSLTASAQTNDLIQRPPEQFTWENMQRRIDGFVAQLKMRYPDLPEYQLELIGDLYGGAFRLERSQYTDSDIEDDIKETKARIAHNQAHSIFYAGHGEAELAYVVGVRKQVELFDRIAKSPAGKTETVDRFWNGVVAEVAILKSLNELGYQVFLPDYSADPYDIPWEDNEVLQWDVKSGVDMVAVKNNSVFLIDGKSKTNYSETDGNFEIRYAPDVGVGNSLMRGRDPRMNRLPPTLRAFVEGLNPVDVRRARILLPGVGNPQEFISIPRDSDDKTFLQNFAMPRRYIRDEIRDVFAAHLR